MKSDIEIPKFRIFMDRPSTSGQNVFLPEEFRSIVKYERTRSDRNGSVFSVVVFNPRGKMRTGTRDVVARISQFCRSIDSVGYGENGQVNVLLPDTIRQGADIFGKKVQSALPRVGKIEVPFTVYSYPEDWLYPAPDDDSFLKDTDGENETFKASVENFFVNTIPAWKRVLDVSGAAILLMFASPVFLFLAVFIKIVSPGPVFFHQTRIGYKGRPFKFWKFRTMQYGNNQSIHGKHAKSFIASGDIPMEKLDSRDSRIIYGGRVIRKCCLDELPQLWNVLRGEMSLVGPRPCIPYEAKEYLRWHTHRFDVLPGLTGLWQVSGKNKLTFKQMIRLDIAYCRHISVFGDLVILFRTPIAIAKMVFEAAENRISEKIVQRDAEPASKEKEPGEVDAPIGVLENVLSSQGRISAGPGQYQV